MLRILTFCDYFLPGFKGGGPVQTLRLMATRLAPGYQLRVVTRDRDLGDTAPYPGLITGRRWVDFDGIAVRYLPPLRRNPVEIASIIRSEAPDILYLNSFHSFAYTFLPLLVRSWFFPKLPVVLATRGEFSTAALKIHPWRKRAYRHLLKSGGLIRDVVFQASTDAEARDIRSVLGPVARVVVAPDLTNQPSGGTLDRTRQKQPGQAHIVFLGRISAIKNLPWFIRLLGQVPRPIVFQIWGPPEDPRHERECRALAAALPRLIEVRFMGPIPHSEVSSVFATADALVLPSLSENFGQVVAEALAAGCPVLTSDGTPWASVEAFGSGRHLPLHDEGAWIAALTALADMTEPEHAAWRTRARVHANAFEDNPTHVQSNLDLFAAALKTGT